jgi:tRNA dimethylallyltransferase
LDKVIVILGPTATGKSEIAIKLALLLGGEIISADSMQVYIGMDIGTAKPTLADRTVVRHHMLDICEPGEPMTAAIYSEMVKIVVSDIRARGKVPIFAGGTGLYIDAAVRGFLFPDVETDPLIREKLYQRAAHEDPGALHSELAGVDPEAALRIHKNDTRRLVRALEVYETTGKPISVLQSIASAQNLMLASYYGIEMDRDLLKVRLDARVDKMMSAGLLEEVKSLYEKGLKQCRVAMQAIGYKELIAHIHGEESLKWAVDRIKIETRKYAKRQMTWFRKHKDIMWFDAGRMTADEIAGAIAENYRSGGEAIDGKV